jgi:hypothetical protein
MASNLEAMQRLRLPLPMLSIACTLVFACSLPAHAQKKPKSHDLSGYERSARSTVLHIANVYGAPNTDAPALITVTPGHEVVVLEHNGPWVRVFANTDTKEEEDDEDVPEYSADENADPATGWVHDQGLVGPTTPDGDTILFGAAANYEAQAAEPHAPKDAANEARLLYRRVADYFPDSPLAARAAYRSADIRWQLDKFDNSTLPSAHEQEAFMRPQLYEGGLRRVMKNYANTPYAALAAYDLIDNKVCGDWQGLPKCPEEESVLYEKYADRYPDSPKAAEALFNAAYRQGAAFTMYLVDEDAKRAAAAAKQCRALADELHAHYAASDFAARAAAIAYKVSQSIPITGSDRN